MESLPFSVSTLYNMNLKTLPIIAASLLCVAEAEAAQQPLKLWYKKAATAFEQALPLGNGRLGATVYGDADNDVIALNDLTLWSGKPYDRSLGQGQSKWIPEIRKVLFQENYRAADSLQRFVQGPNSAYYMPLGSLYIKDLSLGQVSGYQRELDIDSALCRDRYVRAGVTYRREYLVSHPDGLIAIRISASQPGRLNYALSLTSLIPHQSKAADSRITMTGHAVGDADESTHYCTILKVEHQGGEVAASDSTLWLRGASEATIYLVNTTSYNGFDKHPVKEGAPYMEQARTAAEHAGADGYAAVRKRHVDDYRSLFARMSLTLGTPDPKANTLPTDRQLEEYSKNPGSNQYLETLYAQFGRYLLISCSRTPGIPANLQGLWNIHVKAPWRSNYTVNINLEENYWPAEVCNLGELTKPLFQLMDNLAVNGRYAARNYYGINRGWCSSHNTDAWAMANPVNGEPQWANWNMGFAWLSQQLWEHYSFSQDKQFLRTEGYPLLKGASEFMSDWLVDNPKKPGELITAPGTSPENVYLVNGFRGQSCYGGTADLAIIKELFRNTLAAAKVLGINDKFTKEIAGKLARLHPYTVGHLGDLNEWYYDWNDADPHHRHQSHLIGLYPGHHISTAATPELAEACRKTLEQKGDHSTGWSTGWRINLWARLGNGEHAYKVYKNLLNYVNPDAPESYHGGGGTYANLFDAHPPFQIDGNFGGTAGVCEMLIQSGDGVVTLLPALPKAWSEGSVSGICARGGFTVDFAWKDGQVKEATLHGPKNAKVTVKYNGTSKLVKLSKQGVATL